MKVGAKDLTRRIATGGVTVVEPSIPTLMFNNNISSNNSNAIPT